MRYLITGATGLVGTELVNQLQGENELFLAVRDLATAPQGKGIHSLPVNLGTPATLDAAPNQLDCVVHLAQSPHYREFPDQATDVFRVNTCGCFQALECARQRGAKKFIMASSGIVYGARNGRFHEDEEIVLRESNLGFYHTSKLCAEMLAENYTPFMDVIILRFFFVYGAGQKPAMLIPRLVHAVKEGTPLTLQGEEGLRINPVHVSDAAKAIVRSVALEGSHKVNVGGPEVLSLREIGEVIGEAAGRKPLFEASADEVSPEMVGDITKMRALLGAPTVTFKEGIRTLVDSRMTADV